MSNIYKRDHVDIESLEGYLETLEKLYRHLRPRIKEELKLAVTIIGIIYCSGMTSSKMNLYCRKINSTERDTNNIGVMVHRFLVDYVPEDTISANSSSDRDGPKILIDPGLRVAAEHGQIFSYLNGIYRPVIPAEYLDYSVKNSLNIHSLHERKPKVDYVSIGLLSTLCLIMIAASLSNSS